MRAALAIPLGLVMVTAVALGQAPRMPGPSQPGYARGGRAAEDAECMKCHASTAREHQASLHGHAFDDPSFQRGYRAEPIAFCRGCHAPESDPRAEPDSFAASHGVTCVTCHRPDSSGPILSATSPLRTVESGSDRRAPHDVVRVADFGTRACASCHEFSFPGAERLGERGRMQKTMTEHLASEAKDQSCASCHMPRGERGKASHRFTASRDPAVLASAVTVDVQRIEGRAVVTIHGRGVGHAFPTGDLFRRLVLRVETNHGPLERPFERTFRSIRDGDRQIRMESRDGRPSPTAHVELALPAGTPYTLLYQRITGVAQTPPFAATVEDETVIARGSL